MTLPKRNRLVSDVEDIPQDTRAANKTGSSGKVSGNIGIVLAKGNNRNTYPYTVIVIVDKKNRADLDWAIKKGDDVIRPISGLSYRYIKKQYNLR